MKTAPFAILLVVAMAGCFTSSESLKKLSVGMTKAEVITAMGQPTSVAAQQDCEYLVYLMANRGVFTPGYLIDTSDFYIRLVDGRVTSYGRKGDFGSTNDPTHALSIKLPPPTNTP